MFLLLLLKTTFALNLTTSPLPTAGSIQSWTPTISSAPAMASSTITANQTPTPFSFVSETPTISPSYSFSYSPSPEQTQIPSSPVQTQTPSSTSQPPVSSQVSIYDTVAFKAGTGVAIGIIAIIAMVLFMKSTSPINPPFVAQTTPVVAQTTPVVEIQNPLHADIVTGKILADGWKSATDETGDVWYVNSVTGESSWVPKYKD